MSVFDNKCPYCGRVHGFHRNKDDVLVRDDYDTCIFIRVPKSGEYWHSKWLTVAEGETVYCDICESYLTAGTKYYSQGYRGYDFGLNLHNRVCEPCNNKMKKEEGS